MTWLAFDIGGANLKLSDGRAFAVSQPFPLWKEPRGLESALRGLIASAPSVERIAVTMTGELADCFETKREGVEFILRAVAAAAERRDVRVYRVDGTLAALDAARATPQLAAASNWHALARFAGRYAPRGAGLLIDIGSTTCDLIPLVDGVPAAMGRTDTERLLHGELVYTGVERSPLCAIVADVPYRGHRCAVAQELFATTWDVYLTLGDLPEDPAATHTADCRPATKHHARDRLARLVCADRESFSDDDAREVARAVAAAQLRHLVLTARPLVARRKQPIDTVVVAGSGEFLARRLVAALELEVPVVSLTERLGPVGSRCAAAYALATLAREERP